MHALQWHKKSVALHTCILGSIKNSVFFSFGRNCQALKVLKGAFYTKTKTDYLCWYGGNETDQQLTQYLYYNESISFLNTNVVHLLATLPF